MLVAFLYVTKYFSEYIPHEEIYTDIKSVLLTDILVMW